MAQHTGTTSRYDVIGDREDLTNAIYDISPEKTPFYSGIGRGKAKSTFHEWQTDSLDDVDASNAAVEGDDASFEKADPTVRVGNVTQISDKTILISGTLRAIDLAGRKDELARQLAKKSKALKRDLESILLSNQGADFGSDTDPRLLAGMGAWHRTNTDFAGDGADPAAPSGAPAAGRTDGTQRAFTLDQVKSVMQSAYDNGGEPSVLMVGTYNKTVVSSFTGIATTTVNISNGAPTDAAIIASVDILVTDFGKLRVVPNRFQRARDAWVLDMGMYEVDYLRNFHTDEIAKTGDGEKRILRVEYTLKVKNEAGSGLVADLETS